MGAELALAQRLDGTQPMSDARGHPLLGYSPSERPADREDSGVDLSSAELLADEQLGTNLLKAKRGEALRRLIREECLDGLQRQLDARQVVRDPLRGMPGPEMLLVLAEEICHRVGT
jgi:hypothetical protein